MSTWVALEPLSTVVDAGGEAVVWLRVRNTGDIVEEYRVDAVGEPALWCTIEPTSVRLYPGTTGSIRLTFAPPRSPDSAAGPHPYGVRVTPVEVPDAVTVPEGNLTVSPFVDVRAELLPVTVRAWRRAKPRLVVDNYGNTTVTASVVAGSSGGNQVEVDIRQPAFQIPPGRASFSVLRLRPDRLHWFGQKTNHPYTTTVQPSGSEPVPVAGAFIQSALMPRWLSRLAMLLALILMAFLALWLTVRPSVSTRASDLAAATGAPVTVTTPATPTTTATTPPPTKASADKGGGSATTSTAPAVTLPGPAGWWKLNDGSGSTAADTTGANAALGVNSGWCPTPACATFNGTNSQISTPRAVVGTGPGNSFTVAAWVYMTGYPKAGSSGFETFVSQDGAVNSGFYLQYSSSANRWAFSRPGIQALSTSVPALNTWTRLVGVFDASDNQLRIYVNGVLEGTRTDANPVAAEGDLIMGRAQFNGQAADWFAGDLKDVIVYNVALTGDQVKLLQSK